MNQIGHVRAERSGSERMPSRGPYGDQRNGEQRDEQREADRAELGEGLDVETVCVSYSVDARWLMRKEVALVRAGACAEQWMSACVVPSQTPEVRSAVPGKAE